MWTWQLGNVNLVTWQSGLEELVKRQVNMKFKLCSPSPPPPPLHFQNDTDFTLRPALNYELGSKNLGANNNFSISWLIV
jgi:hypothetical protein